MFNKPTKRKKLYAVIVDKELIGIFPTKKMTQQLEFTSTKQIVELFWTGGFYTTEKNEIQNVAQIPAFDF